MFDPIPPEVGIPPDVPEGTITDIRAGNKPIGTPLFIPAPDPNQTFALPRFAPVWNDVWGWTKNAASDVLGWFQSAPTVSEAAVQRIVESYVGESQKAMSSFIDDAVNFAAFGLNAVNTFAYDAAVQLLADVQSTAVDVGNIRLDIDRLLLGDIPAILSAIGNVAASIDAKILNAQAGVERWAVDNIFKPLYEQIGQAEAQASQLIDAKTAAALGEAKAFTLEAIQPIYTELTSHANQLLVTELAVGALQKLANDCTVPMCDVMGPNTDLGKFLKALNFAATAALLAELASLDGAGIENVLRGLVSLSSGVTNDIEQLFTGGETVGGLLTKVGG